MSITPKKFVLKDDTAPVVQAKPEETPGTIEYQEQKVEQPQQFTTSAFSIVKHDGAWTVVEIPLDPVTGKTGTWIYHKDDGTKMVSINRFKLEVARSGLINM